MKKNSAKALLHSKIIELMTSIGKWDESLVKELPSSWEFYNGFIIFSIKNFESENWFDAGPQLWQLICSTLKGHSVAVKGQIKNDGFRTPQAKLVFGNSSIVHYLDNGIKYSWDVEKNMFCAGNVTERHRIGALNCHNEEIVDLFAGIGYFTLPYLVRANAKFVHACEWNPDAVESLRRNLHLNKVNDRCKVYVGDNRQVCPKKVANRVNLGLIPSSEDYWKVACEALVESGGILYIHSNVTSQLSAPQACMDCENLVSSLGVELNKSIPISKITFKYTSQSNLEWVLSSQTITWKYSEWFVHSLHISHVLLRHLRDIYPEEWTVCVDSVFRVKSYAPHIDHLVYTVHCFSKNCASSLTDMDALHNT